jgi:hypothetical protein
MSYRSQLYYEKFRELLSKGFDHDTANSMSVKLVDEELDGKPKPEPMTPLQICNLILDEFDPEGARVREAIRANGPEVNPGFIPEWKSKLEAQQAIANQIEADRIFAEKLQEELNA